MRRVTCWLTVTRCFARAQCFHEGLPPDINCYDAAAWSAPGPLSEISVAWQAMSLPFPDFTRGGATGGDAKL